MSKFSFSEKATKIYAIPLMVLTLIDGTNVYGILRKAEHYQLFFMFNLTRKARMKRKESFHIIIIQKRFTPT